MPQFDNRNLKASHGLQKHDLSYRNAFTSHFGMLLPFCVVDVVGHSRVELSCEHQTRTLPLNSAAFVRLREHYDYFFVPYSQLYKQYDNFKTQQSNQSSMLDKNAFPNIVTKLPSFGKAGMSSCLEIVNSANDIDAAGYNRAFGAQRLFDLLGYGHYQAFNPAEVNDPNFIPPNLQYNPFRLLAYQKIYFDFYRNDKYEENATHFYNIDDIASAGTLNNLRVKQASFIHYRWRRKDYFTQCTPDLLPTANQFNRSGWQTAFQSASFGANILSSQFTLPNGSIQSGQNVQSSNYFNAVQNPNVQSSTVSPSNGSTVTSDNNVIQSINGIHQSEIQHRLIESRQRLLERMYAANSDFSSQMLAIYGYAPVEGRHGKVKHIGGFSELLNVTDVNNNTNGYQSLNDGTFGKINNVAGSKKFKFHVPEDGIIMGIYSTDCMPDYSSRRIDRFNFKLVPEDYFNPYYEGLGKQALFSYEYSNLQEDSSTGNIEPIAAGVIGFVPRYAEYKAKVDEVHNQLDYGGVYENYTSAFNVDMIENKPMLSLENLINKPMQLNKIFFVDFDGSDKTDCFLLNLYNSVKVLAPIRRNSEL